jgi:hypothetical protein
MRVRFEYTIDDLIDVSMRLLKRSRSVRASRHWDLLTTALLSGVLLFAIVPASVAGKLIMGGLGLAFGALSYPAIRQRTVRRRLRKFCEETVGTGETLFCEVELNESDVHTNSNGSRTVSAWENVKEIQETLDSVDIYTGRGGLTVVRKRAFASQEETLQFIALANQYWRMAARTSQSDGRVKTIIGTSRL